MQADFFQMDGEQEIQGEEKVERRGKGGEKKRIEGKKIMKI